MEDMIEGNVVGRRWQVRTELRAQESGVGGAAPLGAQTRCTADQLLTQLNYAVDAVEVFEKAEKLCRCELVSLERIIAMSFPTYVIRTCWRPPIHDRTAPRANRRK